MTEKTKKLTKTQRMLNAVAPMYLLANGWRRVEAWERDYPGHSEELRKRVDALAAAHCGRGKCDPNHPGIRARKRWAKAYNRCLMMVASPDWWRRSCPTQWALIDPPTLPPSEELEGLSWEGGSLAYVKRPEAMYVDENETARRNGYSPFPPLRESEVVDRPEFWHPEITGRWHPVSYAAQG